MSVAKLPQSDATYYTRRHYGCEGTVAWSNSVIGFII